MFARGRKIFDNRFGDCCIHHCFDCGGAGAIGRIGLVHRSGNSEGSRTVALAGVARRQHHVNEPARELRTDSPPKAKTGQTLQGTRMIRRLVIPAALTLLLGACATYDSPHYAGQRDRYSGNDGYYSDDGYRGSGYDDSNSRAYYGDDGNYADDGYGNDGYYAGDDSGGDYYFGTSSSYNDYGYGYQPYGLTFGFGYGGGYYPGSFIGLQYGAGAYGYSPWYRGYGYGYGYPYYPYYGNWHRRHDRDHGNHGGNHNGDHDSPGPTAGDPPGGNRASGSPINGSPYVRRLPEPGGTPMPPGNRRRNPPAQSVPEPFADPDRPDVRMQSPRDAYERQQPRTRRLAPPMQRNDRNGPGAGGDYIRRDVEPGDSMRPERPRMDRADGDRSDFDRGDFNRTDVNRATIDRRDARGAQSPPLQSRPLPQNAPRPFVQRPPPRQVERPEVRRSEPPPRDDNDSRRPIREQDQP